MAQKVTGGLIRDVFLDILREILYFPIWWYSRGLAVVAGFSWQRIKNMEARLGVKVWVVNIFRPMFGQRDIAGVLISFFMRIFQIIIRSIVLVFYILIMILVPLVWLVLPLLVLLALIFNLVEF